MPSSALALNLYSKDLRMEDINAKQVLTSIYKGEVTHSNMEIYHQVQLNKYLKSLRSSNIVYGYIDNEVSKTLTSVKYETQDSKIHGSNKWYTNLNEDIKWRFRQNGNYSIRVTVDMPYISDEVLATILLQEGLTVTISMESDSEGEYKKVYFVYLVVF